VGLTTIYASIGSLGYLIGAISLFSRLFHPKGPNILLSLSLGSIAIVMHTLLLSEQMFAQPAVNFNLANVISLVALLISLITTGLALKYKVNLLLPVVYGFSGIWLTIEALTHPSALIPLAADKMLIITHITIALISYAILVIATLYSYQVNYINSKLKTKNISDMKYLPPLMQVERQLFFILSLGTLCLLISEITGFIFLENMFSKENAHKSVLSIVALIVYLITIRGHWSRGWRGQKVMVLLSVATLLLTLSYFGSRFVKEFLLS